MSDDTYPVNLDDETLRNLIDSVDDDEELHEIGELSDEDLNYLKRN